MWHAQQKWAITCLGLVLIRNSAKSTAANPCLERVYAMYLTEVREHVAAFLPQAVYLAALVKELWALGFGFRV